MHTTKYRADCNFHQQKRGRLIGNMEHALASQARQRVQDSNHKGEINWDMLLKLMPV